HWLQPKVYGKRVSLGDKAQFTRHCVEAGLPVAEVLAMVSHGAWTFSNGEHPTDFRSLDCDLFIKPLWGRGARGTEWFIWLGGDRYRDRRGCVLSRAKVLRRLTDRSKRDPLLVQPRLVNHPEIADLARDSLMVFRVFTCLDDRQKPHVTHAMLRILGKLEPSW